MIDDPFNGFCKCKGCPARTRAGCRLLEHPKIKNAGFYVALLEKTLVNEDELEKLRAPLVDVLDEWKTFENALPGSCQRVLGALNAELKERNCGETLQQIKEHIDDMRRDKGRPPIGEAFE